MPRLLALILPVIVATLLATDAAAQACVGLPSFAGNPLHLNVAGEFPEGATGYAVGVGAGMEGGLFGNVGGGQVSYDGFEEKATLGFAELGFQLPFGRVQACPILGAFVANGPNDPVAGLVVKSWGAAAGAAVGMPVAAGPLNLIPNAAFRFEYVSQDVEELDFFFETSTYKSTVLDLGLALLFRDRISVQPLIHIPVTSDDEETEEKPSFGVFASVSFGLPR
ncbi:MAG TPA: hypothetical protein VMN39_10025 [Longimicrobiaceae bacterium]|nr:hypothetical protein [Longimicrobiaceae bacterium]